jgi:hypothetical protein
MPRNKVIRITVIVITLILITVIVITLALVFFARLVWKVHVGWEMGRLEDVKVIIVEAAPGAGVPDQAAIWRLLSVGPSKVHRSRFRVIFNERGVPSPC